MGVTYDNYPPGVSAIVPRTTVPDANGATYGRAEVEQYLADNPWIMRGVPGGSVPRLGTVEFITAVEASARRLNVSIGRPDNAIVCWAEIIGPLEVTGISVPAFIAKQKPPVFSPPAPKEILVFDAQTGNLLLSGYSN